MIRYCSAEEAVNKIKSNQSIFIQGAAMTPVVLIDALMKRAEELSKVELMHLHTEGPAPYVDEKYRNHFHVNTFFTGSNLRQAVNHSNADYIPIFLSEIHLLFEKNILRPDVSFIQVSPPDEHGFCSLGTSVDITLAAIRFSETVIAEVNDNVPRTHGAGLIHYSKIHQMVSSSRPIFGHEPTPLSACDKTIGKNVASLIEDGATLQMGIGAIPDAVLHELNNHKRLGIHTEMFSDGIIQLVESGVITGEEKKIGKGKIVSCFALGSQRLYDFMNDNPMISMREASYTNDTQIIRMNPKVTAINSAIEIDLTGQVCADTIGTYQYSGVGGQMDFIRGASLSERGKPIIAMPSVTKNGDSKIVSILKKGAGITSTRAHIHYVVTEYGIADLYGKNLRERMRSMIGIANPEHREKLEKEAFEIFKHQ